MRRFNKDVKRCGTVRIMVSRHSAFYSPLIAAIAGGFLDAEGADATYEVLRPGQRTHDLLRRGIADVIQSAVSTNWTALENGETDLPRHFALINRRDGFFLAAREADPSFNWQKLEGRTLLADHGRQPLAMLRYAAWRNGVDWTRVNVVDAGSPDEMHAAFLEGRGDYVHLQGPAPQQLERSGSASVVVSVGESMPPVAFSTLTATHEFLERLSAKRFARAYRAAREWVNQAPAEEIARREAAYFPAVELEALAAAIRRYQSMGTWSGDIGITPELYDRALDVFEYNRLIGRRHAFEEVVAPPPAEES